jgi:hypothetical protein
MSWSRRTYDYKIPVPNPATQRLMEASQSNPVFPVAIDDAIFEYGAGEENAD